MSRAQPARMAAPLRDAVQIVLALRREDEEAYAQAAERYDLDEDARALVTFLAALVSTTADEADLWRLAGSLAVEDFK